MKYALKLAYDGTEFSGFQRQKNTTNTIQETIEKTLSQSLKEKITLVGCGRTDAGVHASQYIAHITTEKVLDPDMLAIFNHQLPNSINIQQFYSVPDEFHAQFKAISRTYEYHMHWERDPFRARFSSYYPIILDDTLLSDALQLIKEQTDFYNFCLQPEKQKHTFCEIYDTSFSIFHNHGTITITANRFLRGMIRMLIQSILDVHVKKISMDQFSDMLRLKEERPFHQMAFPQGLCLTQIKYSSDYEDIFKS